MTKNAGAQCERALTPTESAIVALLRAGLTQKEAACKLGMGRASLRKHLQRARKAAGAATTYQLIAGPAPASQV